MKINMSRT